MAAAKKPAPPPLTAALILKLKSELQTQFATSGEDQQIRTMREVREKRDAVPLENRWTTFEYHDATIADEIARNVATLTLNPPSVACTYAPGGSEPAEHNTTLRELFYEELLENASRRIEGENARVRATDMCLSDGGAWKKVVFAKDLWEEAGVYRRRKPGESYAEYEQATEQAKKDCGQPFVIRAIDPLSFYPVRKGTKLIGGMEVQRRPVIQTLLEKNLGVDGNGELYAISQALGQPQNEWDAMKLPDTVELVEFWDEWRCVPADTMVAIDSAIRRAYKRWYEGQLVEIVTAGGNKLSGTPNHPILTNGPGDGWVALGDLKVGDYVLRRVRSEDGIAATEPHVDHVEAPIGQVFDALANVGKAERRRSRREDFHGDGRDEDIDIVVVDGVLMDGTKAPVAQHLGEVKFALPDEVRTHSLTSERPIKAFLRSNNAPAIDGDQMGGDGSSLSQGGVLPAQQLGVGMATKDTGTLQAPLNESLSEPQVASNGDGGLPSFYVTTDQIVSVNRKSFSGYVYNLETDLHRYSSNGIITHNCYQVLSGIGKNGFLLDPWEHGYGRPPYFWAPGFLMGHWANRKVGWGIAETKRSQVQYSSFLRTVLGDVAARDAYRPVIHTLGEDSASKAQLKIKEGQPDWTEDMQLELRTVLKAYPGDKWEPFPAPEVAQSLISAIEFNDKAIQASLTPRVSSEIGGSGGLEGAGFAMTTVLAEAKIGHHPYVQNLEECDEAILDFFDYLIVNKVKGDVWLYCPAQDEDEPRGRKKRDAGWLKLGPSDISGYPVKRKVTIDPEKPTAKLVEGRYHIEQVNAGMESMEEAIIAQNRNPDQVRYLRTKERILNSDWMMAKDDQDVAQELGYGHLLARSKLAAIVAQTGGLPGLAPPPGGFPSEEAPSPAPATTAGVGTDPGQLAAASGGKPPDMAKPSNGALGTTTAPMPQNGSAAPGAVVGSQ